MAAAGTNLPIWLKYGMVGLERELKFIVSQNSRQERKYLNCSTQLKADGE